MNEWGGLGWVLRTLERVHHRSGVLILSEFFLRLGVWGWLSSSDQLGNPGYLDKTDSRVSASLGRGNDGLLKGI